MPLASAEAFEGIVLKLSVLRYIVSSRSKRHKYDLNKQAERFFMNLLNIIEGWNLEDLNVDTPNAAVIDLGDKTAKVSVQITAETGSTKIKDTIKAFVDKDLYRVYSRLIFVMIAGKKNYSTEFSTNGKFCFSPETDILDIDDLLEKIELLDFERLQQVNEFVGRELAPVVAVLAPTSSLLHKVEAIIDTPPKTAQQFLIGCGYELGDQYWNNEFKAIKRLYGKLSKLSQEEREYLVVIMTRGKVTTKYGNTRFRIAPTTLRSILNGQDDRGHFSVLEDAGLMSSDPDYPPTLEIHFSMESGEDFFVSLSAFCKKDIHRLKRIVIDGNFALLD